MQASTVGLIAAGSLPQRTQPFSYFGEDFLAIPVHICACIGCQLGTYVYMHISCSSLAQLMEFPDSAKTLRFWEPVIIPTFATSLRLQSDVLNCDAFVQCFAHVIHGKSCNGSCYHSFHFNTCMQLMSSGQFGMYTHIHTDMCSSAAVSMATWPRPCSCLSGRGP